jgi:hypothetical protein
VPLSTLPQIGQAQFTYAPNNSGIAITGYTSPVGGELEIPEEIGGSVVTEIGTNAFRDCFTLTNVTIPASVTCIDDGAFDLCQYLIDIKGYSRVTNIGNGAFAECSALTAVSMPLTVTNIGFSAFADCAGITSITIPNNGHS